MGSKHLRDKCASIIFITCMLLYTVSFWGHVWKCSDPKSNTSQKNCGRCHVPAACCMQMWPMPMLAIGNIRWYAGRDRTLIAFRIRWHTHNGDDGNGTLEHATLYAYINCALGSRITFPVCVRVLLHTPTTKCACVGQWLSQKYARSCTRTYYI